MSWLRRPDQLNPFVRNVLALMSGTSLAQLIAFLAMPLLTRIYSPEDFGLLAVVMGVVSIGATMVTGRYEFALILPKSDREAFQLFGLAVLIALVSCGLMGLASLAFPHQLANLVGSPELAPLLWSLPLLIFLKGLSSALMQWYNRTDAYTTMAAAKVCERLSITFSALALGITAIKRFGLVLAELLGSLVVSALLMVRFRSTCTDRFVFSWARAKPLAIKYKGFPIFDTANALAHTSSSQGILILLNRFFGGAAIGSFALTERIMLTPFRLFSTSFSQVFFRQLARLYHEDPRALGERLAQTLNRVTLGLALPFGLFVLLSKPLLPIVLGAQWVDLYRYVHVLAPMTFISLTLSPLGHVLKILDKQHVSLLLNCIMLLARLLTVVASHVLWNLPFLETLFWYSCASFISLAINAAVICRLAGINRPHWIQWLVLVFGTVYYLYCFGAVST